ncbi:uncharacterized protein LOC108916093 [Anoplophora glabripennis]|uniref:uncharacterized protein LOC108916093 n=1 Tax=Anoplophora glabripennis TaxID=217634 RepID=UPI000874E70A|nr:uncharacterized protein LOC108916093 [Anoplophora glabripennis]
MIKCLKIQAFKITNRAMLSKNLNIIHGVSLTQNNRYAKNIQFSINDTELDNLGSEQLDNLLTDTSSRFFETHKLDVNIPRLLEEGRKKNKGEGNGALYWALAIKGSFLAMAYKGIAVMAGLALIMGKMALLLSAILGLKKLINSGHESTTFEIIKQPKYTEQHTHSTSYEDDGHHHRSYSDIHTYPSKRIYKTYI